MGEKGAPLLAAPRTWKQHGESGLWASEWIPHIAECMDDIAVIRSCWTNGINHAGGVCQMNTCINVAGRPSLGSWVNYGLGSENQNLPAFLVMCDSARAPVNGSRNWGTGFMPASYQGVRINGTGSQPIANLKPPKEYDRCDGSSANYRCSARSTSNMRNERPQQTELDARIRSYELAFRMQAEAPEAVDLTDETERLCSCMEWIKRRPKCLDATACWLGGWSNAACGSFSFTAARAANGIPTRHRKESLARCAARWTNRSPAC